ncbi:MAG: hypothetical protein M1837_006415 [Sclerophora amabilis]|nr:MAG: hypothetical protein M1837_006415 [Sclerophora amabilis]
MVAPVRHRSNNPHLNWKVNTDPKQLDLMYIRLLGPDGHHLLTQEVKWLAVTHKSFDHGRRGFNDRLAFLGRRIVALQASLGLVYSRSRKRQRLPPDPHGREPHQSPALEGIENLTEKSLFSMVGNKRVAQLANKSGLATVMQWVPRKPDDLITSGIDIVLADGLYAIVGAIALQKGGELAAKIARERVLVPLGMEY